jgi:hypothetical protein
MQPGSRTGASCDLNEFDPRCALKTRRAMGQRPETAGQSCRRGRERSPGAGSVLGRHPLPGLRQAAAEFTYSARLSVGCSHRELRLRRVSVPGVSAVALKDSAAAPPPHLSPRQVEVLRLLEHGCSTKQIAAELPLSTETVRNHVRRLSKALVSTPDSKPSPPPAAHRPSRRFPASATFGPSSSGTRTCSLSERFRFHTLRTWHRSSGATHGQPRWRPTGSALLSRSSRPGHG